jgi:hypothetical protein
MRFVEGLPEGRSDHLMDAGSKGGFAADWVLLHGVLEWG